VSDLPEPFSSMPGATCRRISLQKGQHAFHQGDTAHGFFIVANGSIELRRVTENGATVIIHTARPGESFAEASLFSATYHCDAVALEESGLVEISRTEVLGRLQGDAEFAIALSQRFATQVQGYRRRLELLAIRSASERVYCALADGLLTKDIKTFASEIGLTHEAVYRALATLTSQRKILKTARGCYQTLPNADIRQQ
jgi:CRP-like cAMP-binding protein